MSDEKKEQEGEKVDKAEWDKARQEVEQVKANYEKEKQQREAIETENATIATQLEETQLQIEELKNQIAVKEEGKSDIELDPDLVDKNVIKSITQMKSQLKAANDELKELKSYAEKHKQAEEQREAKTREDRIVNKMCDALDGKFNPKYRNDAIALAKRLVEERKEKPVQDGVDAMILMEKCYKQLSEAEKPKDEVPTDTGDGGITPPASSRKPGTVEEVLADMKENKEWLEAPLGEGGLEPMI